MAITDNAAHALLIDGDDVAAARTRSGVDPACGEASSRFQPASGVRHGTRRSSRTRAVLRAQRAAREPAADTVRINEHLAVGTEMPHARVRGQGQ